MAERMKSALVWLSIVLSVAGCTPNRIGLGNANRVQTLTASETTFEIVNTEKTNGSYFVLSARYVPPSLDKITSHESIDLESLCETGKLRLSEKEMSAIMLAEASINGKSLSGPLPVFAFRFDNSGSATCEIYAKQVYFTDLNLLSGDKVSVDTVFETRSGNAASYDDLVKVLTNVANVGSVVTSGGLLVSAAVSGSLSAAVGATQDYTRQQFDVIGKKSGTVTFQVLNGGDKIENKKLIPIDYQDNGAKPPKKYLAGSIEIEYIPCMTLFAQKGALRENGYPDFSRLTLDDLPQIKEGNGKLLRGEIDEVIGTINGNPELGVRAPQETVRKIKEVLAYFKLSNLDEAATIWVALKEIKGFRQLLNRDRYAGNLADPDLSLDELRNLKTDLEQNRKMFETFKKLVDYNGVFAKTGLAESWYRQLARDIDAKVAALEADEAERRKIFEQTIQWNSAVKFLMSGFASAIKMDDGFRRKNLLQSMFLDGNIVIENKSASETLADIPSKETAAAANDILPKLAVLNGENFGCFFDLSIGSGGNSRASQINSGSRYSTVALYRDENHRIGNDGFLLFYQSHAYQDNDPQNEVKISAFGMKYPQSSIYDVFKSWTGDDSKCNALLETFKRSTDGAATAVGQAPAGQAPAASAVPSAAEPAPEVATAKAPAPAPTPAAAGEEGIAGEQ